MLHGHNLELICGRGGLVALAFLYDVLLNVGNCYCFGDLGVILPGFFMRLFDGS